MYMGVLPMHMYEHHVHTCCCRARRRCQTSWDWNYRLLQATMFVLGLEPRSPGRIASALNP